MTASRISHISRNLKYVSDNIKAASLKRQTCPDPRLVAVSKTKGIEMIIEAYDAGQRHFGENYVQELHDKANDIELRDRCQDIQWHFIGHLQRNKISKILDVPNLFVVETIDNKKLAKSLSDAIARSSQTRQLNVMVQVNTSGEENKNGCVPIETVDLVKYIQSDCPSIRLIGLMTIGSFDHDLSTGPNPDFLNLVKVRDDVCNSLEIQKQDMELSMGMSADYEHAIELGSTNVRVGSTIFGAREKSNLLLGAQRQQPSQTSDCDTDLSKLSISGLQNPS